MSHVGATLIMYLFIALDQPASHVLAVLLSPVFHYPLLLLRSWCNRSVYLNQLSMTVKTETLLLMYMRNGLATGMLRTQARKKKSMPLQQMPLELEMPGPKNKFQEFTQDSYVYLYGLIGWIG